jgi:hypothetical protein
MHHEMLGLAIYGALDCILTQHLDFASLSGVTMAKEREGIARTNADRAVATATRTAAGATARI